MGIRIKREGNDEEVIGLWNIQILGGYPTFKYYKTGPVGVTTVYSWIDENFEIDGKTLNSRTDFMELYSILKAKIDLYELE